MPINPISSAFAALDKLTAKSKETEASGQPADAASSAAVSALQQEVAALESSASNDPLLQATSTDGSVSDSFNSMLGLGSTSSSDSTGDPLLDDLNSLDASTNGRGAATQSDLGSILSDLSSVSSQQAANAYLNGQGLGNSQLPGTGATGGANA